MRHSLHPARCTAVLAASAPAGVVVNLTGSLAVVLAGLLAGGTGCAPPELCPAGTEPTIAPLRHSLQNGALGFAHAHNDYEHEHPLDDALAAGFASVEADVWFRDGSVVVSHDAGSQKCTLQKLYLEPLDAILQQQDSVHDDGAAFTLWLDLKDGTAGLREGLQKLLAPLPWLTRFDDVGVIDAGGVTVILTGDDGSKEQLIDDTDVPRPFARDDNALSLRDGDEGTVVAAALSFSSYIGSWDGEGPPPDGLSRQCGCVVERAHLLGRQVRLFGAPDTEAAWQFQLDHGVDFINTDDLDGLADFLRAQ